MAQNKKICLQKPMKNTLLDEIRVIKNIVDFRMSAVESKIDLLISTCSSIFNNSEILKSQQKGNMGCLNNFSERLLNKLKDIEDLISTEEVNEDNQICKKYNSNSDKIKPPKQDAIINGDGHLLKLSTFTDFPEGSWLGDESDPQLRVRVNIDPAVLLLINEQCTTPEKMALALVDSLFPRDVLAVSNLSGKGRHSKQQLNPILVYGIKCHLKHKFNISESDWYRIKRNIDSKCRTIWRRKKRGLPLGSNQANSSEKSSQKDLNDLDSSDEFMEPIVCYEIAEPQKTNSMPPDEDIQLSIVKPSSEDDFNLLPSVQLFTVDAADCFMLQGHELVIPDEIMKDVDKQNDFLKSELS